MLTHNHNLLTPNGSTHSVGTKKYSTPLTDSKKIYFFIFACHITLFQSSKTRSTSFKHSLPLLGPVSLHLELIPHCTGRLKTLGNPTLGWELREDWEKKNPPPLVLSRARKQHRRELQKKKTCLSQKLGILAQSCQSSLPSNGGNQHHFCALLFMTQRKCIYIWDFWWEREMRDS